jgi:hypothetical protein
MLRIWRQKKRSKTSAQPRGHPSIPCSQQHRMDVYCGISWHFCVGDHVNFSTHSDFFTKVTWDDIPTETVAVYSRWFHHAKHSAITTGQASAPHEINRDGISFHSEINFFCHFCYSHQEHFSSVFYIFNVIAFGFLNSFIDFLFVILLISF